MRFFIFFCIISAIFSGTAPRAVAKTYYVKSDGNDLADGTSDATAWKTLKQVNRYPFKTGDDLCFRCGDQWVGQKLKIDWSGTDADPVVIGAYYLKNGREIRESCGDKPTLDGKDTVPDDMYEGLIHTREHHHLVIENLRLMNSEGSGVAVYKSRDVTCRNMEVYRTFYAGILYKDCQDGVIEGCDVRHVSQVYAETRPYAARPANIELFRCDNMTIRKNLIRESWGEGIGVYWNCTRCTVEDNTLYASKMAGIYLDNAKYTHVRRNLVYGTADTAFHRSKGFMGPGLWTSDEPGRVAKYGSQSDNLFYQNLVANCSVGIYLSTSDSKSVLKNTDVFNNTIVACKTGILASGGPWENSRIRNNIIWNTGDGSTPFSAPRRTPGLTWHHNNWSADVRPPARGTDDVIGLPALRKDSGWRLLKGEDLTGAEFALRNTSPAIDSGIPLDAVFSSGPECGRSNWPAGNIRLADQNAQGNGWEIGADIHVVTPENARHLPEWSLPDPLKATPASVQTSFLSPGTRDGFDSDELHP
ncbi:hypothetical protein DENIS_1876 [Desulfonema ishimotonii]|uniref:Right handed beta helix domain-containing protein n=1 Tax=Desulfonema ishimotonii TaxID=45657 RepID=A0A401FVC3_9BACT|nr:right-handed parallel beta-helix repeat-containing protein [Desulfonema ishimotonii]GBC60916.1 hypothetical protein DENIS_1876 [Desulfonema ishimotonii]